jgi:nicotinamide riboside transporter PnuC
MFGHHSWNRTEQNRTEQNRIEEYISTPKWKRLIASKCVHLFTRIHVIAFQKAQVTLFIDYTNLSIQVKWAYAPLLYLGENEFTCP